MDVDNSTHDLADSGMVRGMHFSPHDGPHLPLPALETEEDAAELVHDCLTLDDIVARAVLLVFCDRDRRPIAPLLIETPQDADPAVLSDTLLPQIRAHGFDEVSSLVFARARAGRSYVLDEDRAWHDAVLRGCADAGMELLSSFVATQHAVIPFPQPIAGGVDGVTQAGR